MYNYVIIFLLSSVKYVLGVGYALVVLDNTLTAITMVLFGSVTGVFVFTLGGYSLMAHFRKKYNVEKKVFSWINRIIVRLKRSGGLPVIAILTPIFLSIPVGCIASAIIYKDRKKVLTFMIASVVLWTIVLFGARELFGLNLKELAN